MMPDTEITSVLGEENMWVELTFLAEPLLQREMNAYTDIFLIFTSPLASGTTGNTRRFSSVAETENRVVGCQEEARTAHKTRPLFPSNHVIGRHFPPFSLPPSPSLFPPPIPRPSFFSPPPSSLPPTTASPTVRPDCKHNTLSTCLAAVRGGCDVGASLS